MLLKPKIKHEVVILLLVFLKRCIVMVFAVIVPKCEENRSVRKVLRELLLHLGVGVAEKLIDLWVIVGDILCDFVSYQVPIEDDEIYRLVLCDLVKKLENVFKKKLRRIAAKPAEQSNLVLLDPLVLRKELLNSLMVIIRATISRCRCIVLQFQVYVRHNPDFRIFCCARTAEERGSYGANIFFHQFKISTVSIWLHKKYLDNL